MENLSQGVFSRVRLFMGFREDSKCIAVSRTWKTMFFTPFPGYVHSTTLYNLPEDIFVIKKVLAQNRIENVCIEKPSSITHLLGVQYGVGGLRNLKKLKIYASTNVLLQLPHKNRMLGLFDSCKVAFAQSQSTLREIYVNTDGFGEFIFAGMEFPRVKIFGFGIDSTIPLHYVERLMECMKHMKTSFPTLCIVQVFYNERKAASFTHERPTFIQNFPSDVEQFTEKFNLPSNSSKQLIADTYNAKILNLLKTFEEENAFLVETHPYVKDLSIVA